MRSSPLLPWENLSGVVNSEQKKQDTKECILGPEWTFLQRRYPDGQQTHEKMLNVTHQQGNTNQNHNEIPPHSYGMAEMNDSGNNRCRRGCGERGTLLRCWWECKLVQPLWKTAWRFLKKLKIQLPYNPAIALLGIYPRDTGMLLRRDTCTPSVYSSAINNSQSMQRTQMSIDG